MKNSTILNRTISLLGIILIAFGCGIASVPPDGESTKDESDIYAGIEFDMPRVQHPEFKSNQCYITDFDAMGDGIKNNSEAFEKAIESMSKKGGGKVIVPRGIWLTGPIVLKNNINLHLEDGALIVFSKDFDEYPLIQTSFEGLNTYRCLSPISGRGLENIAITGSGIIDGSGDAWRPVKKEKMTARQWRNLVNSGGVLSDDGRIWYPTEKSKKGDSRNNFNVPDFSDPSKFEEVKDFLRPVMISLVNCNKVLLDGPTFQNSPAWNIHPLMCENVIIRNVTVKNPWYSQNGDGLDLESSKNVLIYNNSFDVGDDAICIKSGKNEDGRNRGIPTENVIITNNIVYHGHGGFTVGSEMSGGVKNMHVSNCTFIGTDIGLRFKSTRGRGGVVENIYISNINMIDIPAEAIRFNLYYEGSSPIPDNDQAGLSTIEEDIMPVTEETPAFRNIYMQDIQAVNCGIAGYFQGLPEMMLENIELKNATFKTREGFTIIDADKMYFSNVAIDQIKENVINIYNGKNLQFKSFTDKSGGSVRISGSNSEAISFEASSIDQSHIKTSESGKKGVFKIISSL